MLVTSGFGNLNADGYDPVQFVKLLQEIITEDGLIMMPYYPPLNSQEWVERGNVFYMRKTKSGMGVVTNAFAKMPGVVMSQHPTKVACVWGKGADDIIRDHYLSQDPYGDVTPYGRLLAAGCYYSICFGVKNLPMFHAIEDKLLPLNKLYYEDRLYDVPIVQFEKEKLN